MMGKTHRRKYRWQTLQSYNSAFVDILTVGRVEVEIKT
jgi:hypothetical protein